MFGAQMATNLSMLIFLVVVDIVVVAGVRPTEGEIRSRDKLQ